MAFVGDTSTTPQVEEALSYLVRHWEDANVDPGWKGPKEGPSNYQATFAVMKGLVPFQIEEIGGIDWYSEFATYIVQQQNKDGSWPDVSCCKTEDKSRILSTAFALLTLEKGAPLGPPKSEGVAVGGVVASASRFVILAPCFGLVGLVAAAVSIAALRKKRKN